MRCPHCGGLNPDQTAYCIRCGRGLNPPQQAGAPSQPSNPQQRPVYPPTQSRPAYPPTQSRPVYPPLQSRSPERPTVTPQQPRPMQAPVIYPPRPERSEPMPQPQPQPQRAPSRTSKQAPVKTLDAAWPIEKALPAAPEPPEPFPPRTLAHLRKLSEGALDYTVISEDDGYGKKKIVRILYPRCVPWQQMATLLKASKAAEDTKFDTIVIQGVYNQDRNVYEFTNGQLVFDRNVRLGSQTQNRYQIETDNGYSTEALRVVVSE